MTESRASRNPASCDNVMMPPNSVDDDAMTELLHIDKVLHCLALELPEAVYRGAVGTIRAELNSKDTEIALLTKVVAAMAAWVEDGADCKQWPNYSVEYCSQCGDCEKCIANHFTEAAKET